MSNQQPISRRSLLQGAATALPLLASDTGFAAALPAQETKPAAAQRIIKLGLIGNGKRGSWIANLFQQHGGYAFHAAADYFPDVADRCGDAHGVEKSRRFSGLSGFKKVIDSGVEAIVIETPPRFIAEIAAAGAEAGLHVYMAKPAAIDVPGCMSLGAASQRATGQQRVFMVDYQLPTDPNNLVVYQALRDGQAGKPARMRTVGISGGHDDPPKTATLESRLQHQVWDNDIALCGGMIVSYDIHALDAAVWLTGRRPIAAMGFSRIARPNPHGDSCDVTSVLYEYADGLIHEHFSQHLPNHTEVELSCKIYSHNARAFVDYTEKSLFQIRGVKPLGGPVTGLYKAGAQRNIAVFHQAIVAGNCENRGTQRAIDGTLTAILGREAAARRGRLTMEELIREDKRLPLDLTGLKV
jgi:myo-inositol 2-dehydrogenase / D-chiro-inositol 1-dehydrogenase